MPYQIYIVEDHDVVRESYAQFIELSDHLSVCGMAETAEQALEQIPDSEADLVMADVSLPGMSGIELVERLHATLPELPVLIITGHSDERYRREGMEAGAAGFVLKFEGPSGLLDAINRTLGASTEEEG